MHYAGLVRACDKRSLRMEGAGRPSLRACRMEEEVEKSENPVETRHGPGKKKLTRGSIVRRTMTALVSLGCNANVIH